MKRSNKKEVSVLVVYHNEQEHIANSIRSVLSSDFKDFELILVNDHSTDKSAQIAHSFEDARIRHFNNTNEKGIAGARNKSVTVSRGKYLFFTDADCIVNKNWISEGLRYLRKGYCGVEGITNYQNKRPTIADRKVENLKGKLWMTCNMAYSRSAVIKAGAFRYGMNRMEDRDLALRVLKIGEIARNPKMLVTHAVKYWTRDGLLRNKMLRAVDTVELYKKDPKSLARGSCFGRIIYPSHLLSIFIPPLLVYKTWRDGLRSGKDLRTLLWFYESYVLERYWIWKTAVKNRLFVI